MRIVTTEKGKTTTLDSRDLAKIEKVLHLLRILSRECPLIPAYGKAKEALEDVTCMFGVRPKIISEFLSTEEEDGPEQPAGSDPSSPANSPEPGYEPVDRDGPGSGPEFATPDPTPSDPGADVTEPATAAG